jgi:hypothetical protein
MSNPNRHPWFAAFFAFGATMCLLTTVLLVFPGTALDSLWRLNPEAQMAFRSAGNWSVLLMLFVAMLCGITAVGLGRGSLWARLLATFILSANIVGDVANVIVRSDHRALIGLPIGGLIIWYLARAQRRSSEST